MRTGKRRAAVRRQAVRDHERAAKEVPNILGGKPSLNPRMSSRFRINPQTTTVGTKREIKVLPVRPPNKYEHVRVHPDNS